VFLRYSHPIIDLDLGENQLELALERRNEKTARVHTPHTSIPPVKRALANTERGSGCRGGPGPWAPSTAPRGRRRANGRRRRHLCHHRKGSNNNNSARRWRRRRRRIPRPPRLQAPSRMPERGSMLPCETPYMYSRAALVSPTLRMQPVRLTHRKSATTRRFSKALLQSTSSTQIRHGEPVRADRKILKPPCLAALQNIMNLILLCQGLEFPPF
jgi:hypothetical protein